jgi:hypothetical protein
MKSIPDKLRVAVAHLESAALLMAVDGDEKSIHVLIHASEELVRTYAENTGKPLAFEFYGTIKVERRTEIYNLMRKAYNYFKHADKDAEVPYSGPDNHQLYTINSLLFHATVQNLLGLGVDPGRFVFINSQLCILEQPNLVHTSTDDAASLVRQLIALGTPERVAEMRLTAWLGDNEELVPRFTGAVEARTAFDKAVPGWLLRAKTGTRGPGSSTGNASD